MKAIKTILAMALLIVSCNERSDTKSSIALITDAQRQDSIFNSLLAVTNHVIPERIRNDSLAFLILPLQASCPACRKKTIDSIARHVNTLLPNHYIVLSVRGGKKLITSFFREEDADLPQAHAAVFLDSIDMASDLDLYDKKPTMYYTCNKKVFAKVSSIPATVKQDLHQFFSGGHYAAQLKGTTSGIAHQ